LKYLYLLLFSFTIPSFSDVKIYPETSINGLEFSVTNGIPLSTCVTFCEKSKSCIAINYRINEKRCSLLKSMSGRLSFNNNTGGIKYKSYHRPVVKKTHTYVDVEPAVTIPKETNSDFIDDASVAITSFFSSTTNKIKDTFSFNKKSNKKVTTKETDSEKISVETNDIISSDDKNDFDKRNVSSDSIVKNFSQSPIKSLFNCELFDRKTEKLLVSGKCEIKKYLFDDHTKISLAFINGSPFRFEKDLSSVTVYLNDDGQKEKAYFDDNPEKGEVIFSVYRLRYSSVE